METILFSRFISVSCQCKSRCFKTRSMVKSRYWKIERSLKIFETILSMPSERAWKITYKTYFIYKISLAADFLQKSEKDPQYSGIGKLGQPVARLWRHQRLWSKSKSYLVFDALQLGILRIVSKILRDRSILECTMERVFKKCRFTIVQGR